MLWEKTVGSEYSTYRCVVKIGFQKKSLRKEIQNHRKYKNIEKQTTTVFLGPRGVEKGVFQQAGSTQSGAGAKETQNINVVVKNGRQRIFKISLCSENRLSEEKP